MTDTSKFKGIAVSCSERVEWARRELERAVSLMKRMPHDGAFKAAVLSRFDDLETARTALRRHSAKVGVTHCPSCGRATRVSA